MDVLFEKREIVGKNVASIRKMGRTPVVCYGNGKDSKNYSVNTKDLKKIMLSDEVLLDTQGDIKGEKVLIQKVDFHPVSDEPIHADFLFVDTSQEIKHTVSIHIIGEAPGVKIKGGNLVIAHDKIEISALPQNIPGHVVLEVSTMEEIGSHLTVGDIILPKGVTLITSPEEIAVSIVEHVEEKEQDESNKDIQMDEIEVVGKGGSDKSENDVKADDDSK